MYKMDDFEWTALNESKLFEAMVGHKPVGVNKYFDMLCIWEKMQECHIDVPSRQIWTHLETLYNLDALEDTESLPFPNDEREFYLPDTDFGSLKIKKEEKSDDKNGKSITAKRNDNKETIKIIPAKDIKKEEKVINKKDNQRRDSKDGKDLKVNVNIKKDVKKEIADKLKSMKNRSSISLKEEEKARTPRPDEIKRQNKRPTRGSTKPEETNLSTPSRKSQRVL